METLSRNDILIRSTQNKYFIEIDKNSVSNEFIMSLFEYLNIEKLAHEVNFDKSIIELGEEIKTQWWQSNKHKFIKE